MSCGKQDSQICLAVTSSLLPVFQEVVSVFNAENDSDIKIVSASSGNLSHQIINGAPFDIFFAADYAYSQFVKEKLQLSSSIGQLAKGTLVRVANTELLSQKPWFDAEYIAIANPKLAPYGAATMGFLRKRNDFNSIQNRLIMGQNVNQVLQYLITENVPVAFLSKSTIINANLDRSKFQVKEIEVLSPNEIIHSYVTIKSSTTLEAFLSFLESEQGNVMLSKYGYVPL